MPIRCVTVGPMATTSTAAGQPSRTIDGDGEDEADRDASRSHALDGNGEALGERDRRDERDELRDRARRVRLAGVAIRGPTNREDPRRKDGGHDDQNLARKLSCTFNRAPVTARSRPFIEPTPSPQRLCWPLVMRPMIQP